MTKDDADFQNFIRLIDRRGARRFLPDPLPPTGFGGLGEVRPVRDPYMTDERLADAMETESGAL